MVRALSSHQFGPGFKSQIQRHMWVEFVVGSLPCSERFFSGYSGFSSPQKLTFPNSNSTRNQVDGGPLSGCATPISLFILFIRSFTRSFVRSFIRSLLVYLFTLLSFKFFFFHYQAQKKERSTNVQRRIQASFSKLTM